MGWPDLLVLGGAGIMIPAALIQRRWLMLGIAAAILLILGGRVLVILWLERRSQRRP